MDPQLLKLINAPVQLFESLKENSLLIQFSTDQVFDGKKGYPYDDNSSVGPINAYARSKVACEIALNQHCKSSFCCLRLSVVIGRGKFSLFLEL